MHCISFTILNFFQLQLCIMCVSTFKMESTSDSLKPDQDRKRFERPWVQHYEKDSFSKYWNVLDWSEVQAGWCFFKGSIHHWNKLFYSFFDCIKAIYKSLKLEGCKNREKLLFSLSLLYTKIRF